MITITQSKTVNTKLELTNEEAQDVTINYLRKIVIGHECYVTDNGRLEHWTSYPHGSGTTTDKGEASKLQKAASDLIKKLIN